MPSFEVAPDNPIVKAINAATSKCRREAADRRHNAAGFYGTDAAHLYSDG